MVHLIALAVMVVFVYMTLVFILALWKKNNGVVDVAWGLGFILVNSVIFALHGSGQARQWLCLALVWVWVGRLALHIYRRNRGREEDFRYASWRRSWGKHFVIRSFGQIFMLQGLLLLLVSAPLLLIVGQAQPPLRLLDGLGLLIWLAGFLFETVGDRQLAAFIKIRSTAAGLMNARIVELYPPSQLLRRGGPLVGHGRAWPFPRPGAGWD